MPDSNAARSYDHMTAAQASVVRSLRTTIVLVVFFATATLGSFVVGVYRVEKGQRLEGRQLLLAADEQNRQLLLMILNSKCGTP